MKHIIVTGAGSGIGAAISHTLLNQHYAVSLLGRRLEPLTSIADTAPDRSLALSCDVTDADAVAAAVEQATAHFGGVYALVNCAGAAPTAAFHKTTPAQWQQTFDLNVNGVFHCTQAVLPHLLAQSSGRIINIASTAALKGYRYVSAYCAAKHAVLGLTKALALELAEQGITVNALCPGYTDTTIIQGAVQNIADKTGRSPEDALRHFTGVNPQRRLVQPEEVAASVLWLLSSHSAAINGQAIPIDGGETIE